MDKNIKKWPQTKASSQTGAFTSADQIFLHTYEVSYPNFFSFLYPDSAEIVNASNNPGLLYCNF